ncbi:MAG: hypothetical protein AB7L92_02290 [Alphaproteobacteria bacterium]
MSLQDPPKIELASKDALVLERATRAPGQIKIPEGGQFNIRLYRDGKDQGLLVERKNAAGESELIATGSPEARALGKDEFDALLEKPAFALSKENPVLEVTGSGADNTVSIPRNVGLEKSDYIPRLSIQTQKPLMISGGAFISDSSSTQSAQFPNAEEAKKAKARQNMSDSGGRLAENLDELKEQYEEKRYSLGDPTRFLKLLEESHDIAESVSRRGSVDKDEAQKLKDNFTQMRTQAQGMQISTNRESVEASEQIQKSISKLSGGNDFRTLEKQATPANRRGGTPPNEGAMDRQEMRTQGLSVANQLGSLIRDVDRKTDRYKSVPEFRKTLEAAQDIATRISQSGAPTRDQMEKLQDKMDSLNEQAATLIKNDHSFGMSVQTKLQAVTGSPSYQKLMESAKPDADKNKDGEKKKQAMAESPNTIPEHVLAQARAAVDPSISGQEANAADRGNTNKMANVGGNMVSNSLGHTV